MDKKKYKFSNGLTAWQEELTLAQDIKITELFAKVNIQDFAATKVIDLIKIISKENLIVDFLRIILQSENEIADDKLLSLKNSELKGVIEDFFALNPLVSNMLGIFKLAAVTANMNTTSSDTEKTTESEVQTS